ncbi:MAG: hypothetical protein U0166_00355 [Acidobacteriota bacterium]
MAGKLHHLAIKKGAGYNLISIEDFFKLPLSERVSLVVNDQVQFLDDQGNQIPAPDGLRELSATRQQPEARGKKP